MVNPDYTGTFGLKDPPPITTTTMSTVCVHITVLLLFVLSDQARCLQNKYHLIDVGILQVPTISSVVPLLISQM